MWFLNFFKILRLNGKVNGVFSAFFSFQEKKENTHMYMDNIPQEVDVIYEKIKNIPKYFKHINRYDNYVIKLKEHNDLLKYIDSKISNFVLDDIIRRPNNFDIYEFAIKFRK